MEMDATVFQLINVIMYIFYQRNDFLKEKSTQIRITFIHLDDV